MSAQKLLRRALPQLDRLAEAEQVIVARAGSDDAAEWFSAPARGA